MNTLVTRADDQKEVPQGTPGSPASSRPKIITSRRALFSTPLLRFEIDDPGMNRGLLEMLEEMKSQGKGFQGDEILQRSFVKSSGWRSECLKFDNDSRLVKFRDILAQCVSQVSPGWMCTWGLESWAVMSGKGDYHMTHAHSHSDWASVYYVSAGDDVPGPGGEITLEDPRGSIAESGGTNREYPDLYAEMFGRSSVQIKPVDGLLLFFPSWLRHGTLPYKGDRPRVAISTNFTLNSCEKGKPQ